MILVDTSVWIDHLHASDPRLVVLLERGEVVTHPMVIGELALGTLHDRDGFLELLGNLPGVATAYHAEVILLVEQRASPGTGLSLIDAHLLASTLVTPAAGCGRATDGCRGWLGGSGWAPVTDRSRSLTG